MVPELDRSLVTQYCRYACLPDREYAGQSESATNGSCQKPGRYLCRQIVAPQTHTPQCCKAAGSYNAALDLIHTARRAESEGETYTGVLYRLTLAFALRVRWMRSRVAVPALRHDA